MKSISKTSVKFCRWELTQIKGRLFLLRLSIRTEKKRQNILIALAINTITIQYPNLGLHQQNYFSFWSCHQFWSATEDNQQRQTRRQNHAWMTYRVFQAQLRSPVLSCMIKMLMHILYIILATCSIVLILSLTGDTFLWKAAIPNPSHPGCQSLSTKGSCFHPVAPSPAFPLP